MATIVVVNQGSVFAQFALLNKIMAHSRLDGAVWILSFLIGCIFGIIPGLFAAIVCQLGGQLLRLIFEKTRKMTKVGNVYRRSDYYPSDQPRQTKIYQVASFRSG